MADRVAVFNKGKIEQLAAPRELYLQPTTAFVARFVGSANVADAALAKNLGGASQPLRFAPRTLLRRRAAGGTVWSHRAVVAVQFHGAASRWQVSSMRARWGALVSEEDPRFNALRWNARQFHGRAQPPCRYGRGPRGVDFFYRRPNWYPACRWCHLLWSGMVYLGSLFAPPASLYRSTTSRRRSCANPRSRPKNNSDAAGESTSNCARSPWPCRHHRRVSSAAHRHLHGVTRGRMKAVLYVGVMLPVDQLPVKVTRGGCCSRGHRRLATATGWRDSQTALGRRESAAHRCRPRISACSSCSCTCGCRS